MMNSKEIYPVTRALYSLLLCLVISLSNSSYATTHQKNSIDEHNLSLGYQLLNQTPPDYVKANEVFKKSCLENNKYGCYNLGFSYYKGEGTAINYEEAKKWFEKGLQLNDAESAYILGLIYRYEEPKDYDKAQHYLEKSIELGVTKQKQITQLLLADLYLFLNPKKDKFKQGVNLLNENIINYKDGKAAFLLANFYFGSNLFKNERDPVLILKYTYIANELGVSQAEEHIKDISELMTPEQISEAKQKAEEFMKQLNAKSNP